MSGSSLEGDATIPTVHDEEVAWLCQVARYLHMRRMSDHLQQQALALKRMGFGALYASSVLKRHLLVEHLP